MQRTKIGDLRKLEQGTEIRINGWAQDVRKLKNISFLNLRDHTGTVQVTLKPDSVKNYGQVSELNRESVLQVSGKVDKKSGAKSGMEVQASSVEVLNTAGAPLPLGIDDPVEADFDTRLNNRFMDLRKSENNLIFRVKSSLLWGMRKYLMGQNFVEVHTPKVVAAATEGGADLFRVQYFEKQAFLNQSPQLYKEILMASGMDRVFEVGPAFRAEEHNTPRHLNEFTSVDIEMSFSDHHGAMSMLENAVKAGIEEVVAHHSEALAEINRKLVIPEVPFPRVTYSKCAEIVEKKGLAFNFGEDFNTEHLREIGKEFPGFYFITGWPAAVRAFYTMPDSEHPELTNSYDLQFGEKEITSGAQRIHDPEMLEKKFIEKGLNPSDFEFYIKAFRYGMPPHAGWGLGLERLTMILLDLSNIRSASLFPRDRTRIVP